MHHPQRTEKNFRTKKVLTLLSSLKNHPDCAGENVIGLVDIWAATMSLKI